MEDIFDNAAKEVIDALIDICQSGEFVFRGYSEQDQLCPSIIRCDDLARNEKKYLELFEEYGRSYFTASTPIGFLSVAQHYGLPTRLLDFTYNPFIALSFAMNEEKRNDEYENEEDKDYYYIAYSSLKNNICICDLPKNNSLRFGDFEKSTLTGEYMTRIMDYSACFDEKADKRFRYYYIEGLAICQPEGSNDRKDKKQILTKVENEALCFICPNQSNQRVIMQQGLFLMPYTLDKERHFKLIRKNTNVIKISRKLREELINILDIMGYNVFRLMPDLQSICSEIVKKVK